MKKGKGKKCIKNWVKGFKLHRLGLGSENFLWYNKKIFLKMNTKKNIRKMKKHLIFKMAKETWTKGNPENDQTYT